MRLGGIYGGRIRLLFTLFIAPDKHAKATRFKVAFAVEIKDPLMCLYQ
jgi:hypothetical protein